MGTSGFWLIAVSFLAGGFSQVGITQSQVPYLEDTGFPAALAASVLGTVGLGSLIGKVIFGWLCDRIPAKFAWSIGLVLTLVSIAILMNVKIESAVAMVWLYAAFMGVSAGAWLPSMSILVSTNFGLTNYGIIFGVISFFHIVGSAVGPFTTGYVYDTLGSYQWAFIILLALCMVAIITILVARFPSFSRNET
jgi:MFS family permease